MNLMDKHSQRMNVAKNGSAPGNRNTRVVTGKLPQKDAASMLAPERVRAGLVIHEEKKGPVVG